MEENPDELSEGGPGGGGMSLERAAAAVRKRWKIIVALPILAALLAAAIVLALPNRFDASAIVQIDPRQKLVSNLDNVVADLKGDNPTVESEVEIIRSRPIILSVIETLGLRNDPEFRKTSLPRKWLSKFGLDDQESGDAAKRTLPQHRDQIAEILNPEKPGTYTPERDEVAVAFAERLKVVRVRMTLLIDIRFTASDPVKAAKIANTVAETYLRYQIDTKRRANAAASQLLEEKIDGIRTKVSEAERKVEQWKAQNNIFSSEGQVLSEKQMARLMEQTINARNATAEAKANYEQAQKLARRGDGGAGLAEVLKSPSLQSFKDAVANANRKAAELGTKYGPKHPEIIKSRAEVAEAEAQLAVEVGKLVGNLKNDFEVAEGRERQLAQNMAQLKEQEVTSKDAGVDLKELEREAATSKTMLESLLTRYKQTSGTQDFQLPDAHIVEKADIPLYPASPKRKQIVIIAGIGGLIMGLGLAVLLEMMAPGISRTEDIPRTLKATYLTSLPAAHMPDGPTIEPSKLVRLIVAEPASAYADAIRSARRELDLRRPAPGPRIVLLASALPGENADVIASNLAHHYAMTGARVLLADGDARRLPLTRHLAPQRTSGLIDLLATNRPIEAAILRDSLTGLHFLPALGQSPSTRSIPEILSGRAMQDSLARLKGRFDVIILSAPPLLPVLDGRILADYADQIVFVMKWQRTPKALAKKALALLGGNRSKLAGVVLSEVTEDASMEGTGVLSALMGRRQVNFGFEQPPRRAA